MTKYLLGLAAFLVALGGCTRTEYSQVMLEKARVVGLMYSPSTLSTTLMPIHMPDGRGGLHVVWMPHTTGNAARYIITFECQHGHFCVDRADLYAQLKAGDRVIVQYREVYEVKKVDGKEVRNLAKYDFMTAWVDTGVVESVEK